MPKKCKMLTVRPYELMCIICKLGAGYDCNDLDDTRLTKVLQAIKEDPRVPIQICGYEGNIYNGCDKNAPEGVLFNVLRDEAILEKIGVRTWTSMNKGEIHTGFHLFSIVAERISSTLNICGFPTVTSPAWKGCPDAHSGNYEKGRNKVKPLLKSFLPTFVEFKTARERAKIKKESVKKIYEAAVLQIFPSHLPYIIAHYGLCLHAESWKPLAIDNMMEVGDAMRRNPEVKVQLIPHHCMLCPPCTAYDPGGAGLCRVKRLNMKASEMQGLFHARILQTIGVEFYESVPAAKLLRMTFDRMQVDHIAFRYRGYPSSAFGYALSRETGMGFLDAYENPLGVVERVTGLLKDARCGKLVSESDRHHMEGILQRAREALGGDDRTRAYRTLIDRRFWIYWKRILEKVPVGFARLPKAIQPGIEHNEKRVPEIVAHKASKSIVCDSMLNEKEWNKEPFTAGFYSPGGRPALTEIGVKVLYDRQNIHFGVICAEKDTKALKASKTFVNKGLRSTFDLLSPPWSPRTGMVEEEDAWTVFDTEDTFSVYLQPAKKVPLYHFVVNPNGTRLAARFSGVEGKRQCDFLADAQWNATVQVRPRYWTAQISIPFRALGLKGVGENPWRVNFHRVFHDYYLDYVSWSPVYERQFDNRERMGMLRFR